MPHIKPLICEVPESEVGDFCSPPRLRRGRRWHRDGGPGDGGPGASAGVVRPTLPETFNRTIRAAKALPRYETLEWRFSVLP